jgi:hypothetical protein
VVGLLFQMLRLKQEFLTTIVSGNIAYEDGQIPEQPFGLELEFNN